MMDDISFNSPPFASLSSVCPRPHQMARRSRASLLAYAASACHLCGLGEDFGNSESHCGHVQESSAKHRRHHHAHDYGVCVCGLLYDEGGDYAF